MRSSCVHRTIWIRREGINARVGTNIRHTFTISQYHHPLPTCTRGVSIYEDNSGALFSLPSTPDQWREVAKTFGNLWNFHHACGAIDGKHVAIKKSHHSGSEFCNYKGFCSIVLLGMVDEDYIFLWASVGGNSTVADAGIFSECSLRTLVAL